MIIRSILPHFAKIRYRIKIIEIQYIIQRNRHRGDTLITAIFQGFQNGPQSRRFPSSGHFVKL